MAPSNAAIDNIPYTALNGIWDPDNKDATIPLLQYHILQTTVALGGLAAGPTYFETTLLTSSAYTNVTTGQGLLVNKQGEDTTVVISGQGSRCSVTQTDIPFKGGLVQVVDNLLIPPSQIDKTAQAFGAVSFLGSLYAAKLMPDIAYRKNVTIFAPAASAYKTVGGTLQGLNATQLARIMNYHIVPDRVLDSKSLVNGTNLTTLAKDPSGQITAQIHVRQDGNSLFVNTAQIVQPDILLANGVMHLIGNVLNPDAEFVTPNPNIATQPPVYALSTASGAFTTALPCTKDCPVTSTAGDASATAAASTTTSAFFSSTSKGLAPRCTAHVAGAAALGMIGLGAGMALM